MTDYALTFKPFVGKRAPSIGQRLLLWIETNQQRKADSEIARVMRRL